MNLWSLPATEEQAINFLMEHGVLPKERYCKEGHLMKLYIGQRVQWNCNQRSCRKKIGLRNGTWLSDMKLNFVTVVRFIYCWSKEMVSVQFCEKELGMNYDTTVNWCSFMREVCVDSLERAESKKIGGPGTIVEVDESLLTKRKNNSGQVWIFGGLCRETGESFLVTIPDRKMETLTQVIKERIAEGSTIFSDSWRSDKTSELDAQGFHHFKVNHNYNFVDSESVDHTQIIKRMWGSAKWRNKKHRGSIKNALDSNLAEFMWRNIQKEKDIFLQILHDIAIFCPPEINMEST